MTPANQALKVATGALIGSCGGQEAAVNFCGLTRHVTLSEYGNPLHASFARIDVIRDLEAVSHGAEGHPHVTRELARQAGYALVRLPSAKPDGRDWNDHLATCAKEANDVICALAAGLGKGGPRGRRATTTRREIAEAVAALIDLDGALAGVEDTS